MAKKKANKEEVIVDVQEVYSKSEQFFENNKKTLTGIILGLIAVFLLFFVWNFFFVKPKQEAAVTDLYKSQMYFLQDSLDLALNGDDIYSGSEAVAQDFDGVPAAELASYMTAIAYRDAGDYETALSYFNEVSFDDAIIGVLAEANAGDMKIEMGDIEGGASTLESAGKRARSTMSEEFSAPAFLMKAGLAYLELEDFEKAKEMFKIVKDDYPQARNYEDAVKYLASLNNK